MPRPAPATPGNCVPRAWLSRAGAAAAVAVVLILATAVGIGPWIPARDHPSAGPVGTVGAALSSPGVAAQSTPGVAAGQTAAGSVDRPATAALHGTTGTVPQVEPPPPSSLPHLVTVVLAQPPGTTRDATTATALATMVRTDVSRFWSSQTGGRITFAVRRSVSWVRVNAACTDVWGLWGEAARASGFVAGPRRHLVVYVAPGGHCSPGLGTIGTGPETGGYVYLRSAKVTLLAHELGHNLGLGHSNGLQCDGAADAVWSGGWSRHCTVAEYRDWYDVMGVSWDRLGTLSTAQAYRLGVLPADQVVTLAGPGTATLRPVGSTSGVVSLRITEPSGAVYVVEYRPAAGREAWLGSRRLDWRGLRPGVLIRRTDPTRGTDQGQTLLLDASPSHPSGYPGDFDEPLPAGRLLVLGSGRVGLLVTSATPSSATVMVSVDGAWHR